MALGKLFLKQTPCFDAQESPLLAEEVDVVDCCSPDAAKARLGVLSNNYMGRMGMFTCC